MLESDGVQVNLHSLHMRPGHNGLKVVCRVCSGQNSTLLGDITEGLTPSSA